MRPSFPGLASTSRRRRSWTGILLSTLICIFFAVLVSFLLVQPYQHYELLLRNSYRVEIVPAQSGTYEVLLPAPLDRYSNVAPEFARDVAVEYGDATIEIASASDGPALRIVGNGIVRISWVTDWTEGNVGDGIDRLSMITYGLANRAMRAYCDQEGLEVRLMFWSGHWWPDSRSWNHEIFWSFDEALSDEGWQSVPLSQYAVPEHVGTV